MVCEVHYLYKNIRYRLISVDGEHYIVDLGKSFWKILFPLAFWMLPHTAFKVQDRTMVETFQMSDGEQTKMSPLNFFAVGITLILANLLGPLMDYLNISTSRNANIGILLAVVLIVVIQRYWFTKRNKKNLYKHVNLTQCETRKVWIRPKSITYFFKYLLTYLVFIPFSILLYVGFIEYGNMLILLGVVLFLFCLFICSGFTIGEGKTTLKFVNDH
ncbi:DUF443 domain-containing protein [Salipaludibacillus sp. LMS25]|uniref:DUF443 family protein n=1 Tax=Salipaludibacillus sp. LMS25 TaxID=2924031 RepID=UPI0020D0B3FA|nr:DUF443 family protein [Salipaludibacillus sp. LMS25]UTR13814.1 DUF443 domain-containing protein [Salipaludibacillus sp. LMS25]